MPETTSGGIQYPIAGDFIKEDSVEAKLAADMKALAMTADNAIKGEVARSKSGESVGILTADELLSPGRYYVGDPAQATVAKGYPVDGSQTIIVLKNQTDPDSLAQISVTYANGTYKRHSFNGAFTAWERFAMGSDIDAMRAYEPYNVLNFGAKGDGVTDNLAAFNAARDAAIAAGGGEIVIPGGTFLLSGEWDVYRPNSPRIDLVVRGESQWTTKILANFYGASKALIKCVDSSGARSSPTSVADLQLGNVSTTGGVNPVLLEVFGAGESRYESVRFGSSNNTHLRMSSLQNVRMRDIVSFYGGKHYNYRATDGARFTLALDGTLTATGATFATKDVGRFVTLKGTNISRHKILSYVSSTAVKVDGATASGDKAAVEGAFGATLASVDAGSDLVNTNAVVFGAADVGRVIYIRGGRAGAWGPTLLRATIVEIMANPTSGFGQVRIDKPATRTATLVPFATPVIDLWTPEGSDTAGADSNDVKIDLLHVENYGGVGLVVDSSIFMHITNFKVHGEHDPTDGRASTAMMWLNDFGGIVSGELDGLATGDARVVLSGSNDLATFDWLASRYIVNQKTFAVDQHVNSNGRIEVRTFKSYGGTGNGNPYDLVTDANTPRRLWFTGLADMHDDGNEPRFYVGAAYFDATGTLRTT